MLRYLAEGFTPEEVYRDVVAERRPAGDQAGEPRLSTCRGAGRRVRSCRSAPRRRTQRAAGETVAGQRDRSITRFGTWRSNSSWVLRRAVWTKFVAGAKNGIFDF
ncbi:hypothetical protein [Nonomuraea ferruginea]|uniref:Uncharacterized protein n=1 Tax=Nonomuraea ferruginea TaxID=46174 RepID=A0ABT4T3E5_9ACTN|nr:hypothetical protein [Nonomuraea ferruginea]MDA0643930.1 hypothetical protein [Nonomuraea ferruginea]